jgi:hypothetical protein
MDFRRRGGEWPAGPLKMGRRAHRNAADGLAVRVNDNLCQRTISLFAAFSPRSSVMSLWLRERGRVDDESSGRGIRGDNSLWNYRIYIVASCLPLLLLNNDLLPSSI